MGQRKCTQLLHMGKGNEWGMWGQMADHFRDHIKFPDFSSGDSNIN